MGLRGEEITRGIIGAAIEVHRHFGPGLLESAYRRCLAYELELCGMNVVCERLLDLDYKGLSVQGGYRLDLLVQDTVIVEVKAVEKTTPVHEAQLLTYMRLARKPVGLLLNFQVQVLRTGITRLIL